MSMQRFMETVNYRITEGDTFCWQCFGTSAYRLDSWNGEQDGHSLSIVFDTNDQTCYLLEANDYKNNRAYRWTNPDFKKSHDEEAQTTCPGLELQAWDDVNYVELESIDDFFKKASAIVQGIDYDTRVEVPIELPDDVMFQLMIKAHEQDITFNQLVEQALQAAIDRHNRGEEPFSQHARV